MKWKLVGVVMFFAVAILAAVLASGRRSHAQVTNPASTAYAYKVEQFDRRQMKDLGTAPERRRPERLACLPRCGEASLRQHPRRQGSLLIGPSPEFKLIHYSS